MVLCELCMGEAIKHSKKSVKRFGVCGVVRFEKFGFYYGKKYT